MNIRDLLADPFLPVMTQIKQDKKQFFKERSLLTTAIGVSLFVLVFCLRLGRVLAGKVG